MPRDQKPSQPSELDDERERQAHDLDEREDESEYESDEDDDRDDDDDDDDLDDDDDDEGADATPAPHVDETYVADSSAYDDLALLAFGDRREEYDVDEADITEEIDLDLLAPMDAFDGEPDYA